MKVTSNEAKFLREALSQWEQEGQMTPDLAKNLSDGITEITYDWNRLCRYSMWMVIICTIISITSIFPEFAILIRMLSLSHESLFVVFAMIATLFYSENMRRTRVMPKNVYTNEAILFFGILSTAGAIYEIGMVFRDSGGDPSRLLLLGCFIYGVIGIHMQSSLTWIFCLLSLGAWFGARTGYISGWGAYYLGLNYPLRFVLFGIVLVALSLLPPYFTLWEDQGKFKNLNHPTLVMGLLYLFIAFWFLSIFGNYGDMSLWYNATKFELFHWCILFALVSLASIYHGLRFDNNTTRRFGMTFLFINLYTRYFEFFWESTHKAIFFALLAISFWYIGTNAEKIWNRLEDMK